MAAKKKRRAAKKKRRRVYTATERAALVQRMIDGETGAKISRETGITENTLSMWKKAANAGKRTAGAADGPALKEEGPNLAITGLRDYVKARVREEVRILLKRIEQAL